MVRCWRPSWHRVIEPLSCWPPMAVQLMHTAAGSTCHRACIRADRIELGNPVTNASAITSDAATNLATALEQSGKLEP